MGRKESIQTKPKSHVLPIYSSRWRRSFKDDNSSQEDGISLISILGFVFISPGPTSLLVRGEGPDGGDS